MDYSTAIDILFLLAAVYFWPGLPGQQPQCATTRPSAVAISAGAVSPSPHSPAHASTAHRHSSSSSSSSLTVPRIVLHGGNDQQAPQPIFKRPGHKRKSVSFSLSSMAELSAPSSGDSEQPATSPNTMQHRPPTPFHRAPPTPSEIFALSAASPMPDLKIESEMMGRRDSYRDVPTPLTADMVISKEVSDPMGVKKGWLV